MGPDPRSVHAIGARFAGVRVSRGGLDGLVPPALESAHSLAGLVVDAKDAYSIQIYVHYNAFTVPAGN